MKSRLLKSKNIQIILLLFFYFPIKLNPHKKFLNSRKTQNPLDTINQNLKAQNPHLPNLENEQAEILRSITPTRRSTSSRSLITFDYNPNKLPIKSIIKSRRRNPTYPRRRDLSQIKSKNVNSQRDTVTSRYDSETSRHDEIRNHFDFNGKGNRLLRSRSAKREEPRIIKMRDSRRRGMRVKFNDDNLENVINVENWKILNVDMSKEGKMYNRYNMGLKRKSPDACKVF